MLREKINDIIADAPDIPAAVARIEAHDGVFFSDHFPGRPPAAGRDPQRAAGRAADGRDEAADEALEAVFLECLGEFQVSMPEISLYGEDAAIVVLTSNDTQDLSAALERRCLHLLLDYPDAERERDGAIKNDRATRGCRPAAGAGGARAAATTRTQSPASPRRSTGRAR